MDLRDRYLNEISMRGNQTGGEGGLLDLLEWCGKMGVYQVSEEEARRFWEDPLQPYRDASPQKNSD